MDPRHPSLKPHYRVEPTDEGCLLVAEDHWVRLSGRILGTLVPALGRGLTADELVHELEGTLDPTEVDYGLTRLQRAGYLASGGDDSATAAYWTGRGREPDEISRSLADLCVELRTLGEVEPELLSAALERAGIVWRPAGETKDNGEGEEPSLILVLVDDYLRPELAQIDAELRTREGDTPRPWLPCRLRGREVWLGPTLGPLPWATEDDEPGPCWECFAHRLRGRRSVEMVLRELTRDPFGVWPPRGEAEFASAAGAALIAARLVALASASGSSSGTPPRHRELLSFDPLAATIERHAVMRRPQCPNCGDPQLVRERQQRALELRSRPKRFTSEGGHRITRPEHTVARHAHLVSPISGVVPRLAPIALRSEGARELVALVDAGNNQARQPRSLSQVQRGFRQRNGGKGRTMAQARASALCEALERHCGMWQGDELRRRGRLDALGEHALDPAEWLGFSDAQYEAREAWNAAHVDHFLHVPPRFDPSREIDWTPAWSPRTGKSRLLPTALCYYGYPQTEHERFGWADSNGTAAGNCLEEAILQGLLELVERDAVGMWWYNRARRPAVELASFASPYLDRVQEFHVELGRELWAIDLSADLGIPVFAAVSRLLEPHLPDSGDPEGSEVIMFGFGAHLEARLALERAVTELHQLLPSVERFMRGQLDPSLGATQWLSKASVDNSPYLLPLEHAPRRGEDFPRRWADDLRDDLETCLDLLAARGLDMWVLDQTRPDVELSVARVVVPGLRHFWPRFGPGRLFETPVELGWLERPTPEDELNPVPVFF